MIKMANCTDAHGEFSFEDDFYKQNQELIENYFNKAKLSAAYGITNVFTNHDGSFRFEAIGRWSIDNILPWCLAVDTKSNLFPIFNTLFDKLSKAQSCVEFEYEDYDPGMEWRVAKTATLYPKSKTNYDDYFDFQIDSSCDLPMDDYSLIVDNVEDGLDLKNANDSTVDVLDKTVSTPIKKELGINYSIDNISQKIIDFVNSHKEYNGGLLLSRVEDPIEAVDWYLKNVK